jgi:hypothetical protein
MIYVGDEADNEEAAIASAFEEFGEVNKYGEGKIAYRVPELGIKGSAESVTKWYEYLEYALAALGIALLVAGAVISGGSLAPASAAAIGGVVSALGIATSVAGAAFAVRNIYKRVEKGTFDIDANFALDIVSIVGAYAHVAGTTGKMVMMSRGVGAAAKAMQIQRLHKLLFLYDVTELGGNAILVSLKVQEDIQAVKRLGLPKEKEEEMMRQIAMEAVQTGAMLAFASFSKIKDVSEHLAIRVQRSSYKTFKARGWIDIQGNPTDQAPPFMRANKPTETGKRPSRRQQGHQAWQEVQVLPLGKSRTTDAGHELTVTERGRIILCSAFCTDLRMKYGATLGDDPYLEKEMAVLETRAKAAAKTKDKAAAKKVAEDAAAFEAKLGQADELRLHLFGASEKEWEDALEAMTRPEVTGGPKSGYRIGGVKIPKSRKIVAGAKEIEVPRRKIGVTDIMTEAELNNLQKGGYRQAMDRMGRVMGKKISDIPELKSHWDDTKKALMRGRTADEIGHKGMLKLYKRAQRAFWKRVRGAVWTILKKKRKAKIGKKHWMATTSN